MINHYFNYFLRMLKNLEINKEFTFNIMIKVSRTIFFAVILIKIQQILYLLMIFIVMRKLNLYPIFMNLIIKLHYYQLEVILC